MDSVFFVRVCINVCMLVCSVDIDIDVKFLIRQTQNIEK